MQNFTKSCNQIITTVAKAVFAVYSIIRNDIYMIKVMGNHNHQHDLADVADILLTVTYEWHCVMYDSRQSSCVARCHSHSSTLMHSMPKNHKHWDNVCVPQTESVFLAFVSVCICKYVVCECVSVSVFIRVCFSLCACVCLMSFACRSWWPFPLIWDSH